MQIQPSRLLARMPNWIADPVIKVKLSLNSVDRHRTVMNATSRNSTVHQIPSMILQHSEHVAKIVIHLSPGNQRLLEIMIIYFQYFPENMPENGMIVQPVILIRLHTVILPVWFAMLIAGKKWTKNIGKDQIILMIVIPAIIVTREAGGMTK